MYRGGLFQFAKVAADSKLSGTITVVGGSMSGTEVSVTIDYIRKLASNS